jgi:hypothetical protein
MACRVSCAATATRSLIALSLLVLLGAGCASPHGSPVPTSPIDITGVWAGAWSDGGNSTPAVLEFQQSGSTVTGYHRISNTRRAGALQGTIVGDFLRFRGVTADFGGEFTVTGDEMRGYGTTSGFRGLFRRQKQSRG